MNKLQFLLNILAICHSFNLAKSECRDYAHVKVCSELSDFDAVKDHATWRSVVIGSMEEDSPQGLIKFDPLHFYNFTGMFSVTILNRIGGFQTAYFNDNCERFEIEVLALHGNKFPIFDVLPPKMKAKLANLANNSIEVAKFGSQQIEIIILSENNIDDIEEYHFSQLKGLKTLLLDKNKVGHIEDNAFPATLKYLDLSFNNMLAIEGKLFENLLKLSTLILKGNKIKTVPDLRALKSLQMLDVSHNRIPDLQGHIFPSTLQGLDLSYNKLRANSFLPALLDERYRNGTNLQVSMAFNELIQLNTRYVDFGNHTMFLFGNPLDCIKWEEHEGYIRMSQDKCDDSIFRNGNLPYCVNYRSGWAEADFAYDKEIEHFNMALASHGPVTNCFKKAFLDVKKCKSEEEY